VAARGDGPRPAADEALHRADRLVTAATDWTRTFVARAAARAGEEVEDIRAEIDAKRRELRRSRVPEAATPAPRTKSTRTPPAAKTRTRAARTRVSKADPSGGRRSGPSSPS
jgi:hypothetical protein